ncbi:MAG: TrbG/VirB9 family P-type conjugative transfer protein, partial [Polyangiales bacterium]
HAYLEKKRESRQTVVAPLGKGTNVENLNFDYALKGDKPRWRPTHVFDDGQKTFIEMPRRLRVREAPVLILRDHHQDRLVNYRIKGRYYVVDRLFDRAVLIAGVGKRQERVQVLRKVRKR